jgi:hypothetical protein
MSRELSKVMHKSHMLIELKMNTIIFGNKERKVYEMTNMEITILLLFDYIFPNNYKYVYAVWNVSRL